MGVRYYYGNVLDSKTSIAHCVSADLKMSKGVAKNIRERLIPHVRDIKYTGYVGGILAMRYEHGYVYNLVTKELFFGKPKLQDVRTALIKMKIHAIRNKVYSIHMPRIGCGLDRLAWNNVKTIIERLFVDSNVDVAICLKEDDIGNRFSNIC